MINQMVYELAYFISIMLVFMIAYGVANQSILYHNQELNLELFKNIFFHTFFGIHGDYYERDTIMDGKLNDSYLIIKLLISVFNL